MCVEKVLGLLALFFKSKHHSIYRSQNAGYYYASLMNNHMDSEW